MARIGLLLAVVFAGVIFKHSGSAYTSIHVVYIVVIVGALIYSSMARSGRIGRGRSTPGGPIGPIDVRARPAADVTPQLGAPGWFPDPIDHDIERYWDGSAWEGTRHRDGTGQFGG